MFQPIFGSSLKGDYILVVLIAKVCLWALFRRLFL